MSLHQCWAEKVGDSATKVDFWNEFCPQFDWVAPEVVADTATDGGLGYLKAVWDRKRSLHSVNFRKFSKLKIKFSPKKLNRNMNSDLNRKIINKNQDFENIKGNLPSLEQLLVHLRLSQ